MERTIPPPRRGLDPRIVTLSKEHLTREEQLLADLLHSLRQVREAFFQHNLAILPLLHGQQELLLHAARALAQERDHFRALLAEALGIPVQEATLRAIAESLDEPERDELLMRRARLTQQVREAQQLSEQNAALLGYSRGFLTCLFASVTGMSPSERYGPLGQRRGMMVGPFLEARG